MFILLCFQLSYNTVFYGNGYQLKDFDLLPSVSQIAMGAGDIGGCAFIALALNSCIEMFGRIRTTIFATATLIASCTIFLTSFPHSSQFATILSLFIFRALAYVFIGAFAQYWSITFPKSIENICVGLITGIGALGEVIAPLAIRMGEEHKTNPFVYWMVILGVLALLPSVFLPRK